jgi:two-component system, NtrC family, nitrogen regulation sensor histidine kinase NtrY
MSFRTKLFLIFLVTVLASVSVVAFGVTRYTRTAFEQLDEQRTEALVSQFKKEFAQRGEEIVAQVKNITDAEITLKVAIDLARPNVDQSLYVHDASGAAQDHGLDFVEMVNADGIVISSAQDATRVGHKDQWLMITRDWHDTPAFLRKEELPDGPTLSLTAVRSVSGGNDKNLFIVGGRRLDQNFLASLVLPSGMRALLYRNLDLGFTAASLTDTSGGIDQPDRLQPLIEQIQRVPQPIVRTIDWSADPASAETFHALPLMGRNNELLGVLLIGSSRKEIVVLARHIATIAASVAAAALFVGFLFSLWVASRITRPISELSAAARKVAAGQWETRTAVRSTDEIGRLGIAFNDMTRTLGSQREQLVQAERVAAWREIARRLAHELRNPLFPLQITVENLQRARHLEPEEFLEVFNESTSTLKAELSNLNAIVGRFADFSRMPAPQFSSVDLNDALRSVVRLFEPQFNVIGKPTITAEYFLAEPGPQIDADADLLHRAFQNLLLNALDAMPAGGTLTVRTSVGETRARIEITDTGIGLTPEECARLFTPYFTTKQHGTGLGLAIVQAVISDHHGTIAVTSDEARGTTFRIELPIRQAERPPTVSDEPRTSREAPPTLAVASD